MGEGIRDMVSGYMGGQPPPGPADLGITGTLRNEATAEARSVEEVLPNRLYPTGNLRMSEPEAARVAYLMDQLGLSSAQERQRLLERLLSAATDDALWEYARQAGKSRAEVHLALLKMDPGSAWGVDEPPS